MKKLLIALVFVLLLAYVIDFANHRAETIFGTTFNFQPLFWVRIISYPVFAGLITGLGYLILKQGWGNRAVPFIFLAVGLLVLYLNTPQGPFLWSYLPHDWFPRSIISYPIVGNGNVAALASAFITVFGLVGVFARNKHRAGK